jgi:Ribonuclease G/E
MPSTTSVTEAARIMKNRDVGDVIVLDGNKIADPRAERPVNRRLRRAGLLVTTHRVALERGWCSDPV